MEEFLNNSELKSFIDSINSIKELDDSLLNDELVEQTIENITNSFSPDLVNQAINQIIQNLELQGQTRDKVSETISALKEAFNNIIYGSVIFTSQKRKIVDAIVNNLYSIFDTVIEKYHNYSIELPIKLEDGAQVPTYAHNTDAAADIYALEDTVVKANTYGNKLRTGVSIQLPEGWLAFILPRSSIGAKTPLRLSNSVGLIDSGYRGELGVLYDNTSNNDVNINKGDRIAQLLVMPSYRFKAQVVDILETSDRGIQGFGSTGK